MAYRIEAIYLQHWVVEISLWCLMGADPLDWWCRQKLSCYTYLFLTIDSFFSASTSVRIYSYQVGHLYKSSVYVPSVPYNLTWAGANWSIGRGETAFISISRCPWASFTTMVCVPAIMAWIGNCIPLLNVGCNCPYIPWIWPRHR